MKRTTQIISVISLITLLVFGGLWILYKNQAGKGVHDNPDFELFISEFVFKDYDTYNLSEGPTIYESDIWNSIPSAVWQPNDSILKLPVKWILNKNEFESSDSVSFGIQNVSSHKFYYMSWGYPNSRVRTDFFVFRDGVADSILFGGFGCGTGIYLAPLNRKEEVIGRELNPLLEKLYNNYELDIQSDSFPTIFKALYGDSVGIRFGLATYSLPWSKYEPQMIKSDICIISTDKLIKELQK